MPAGPEDYAWLSRSDLEVAGCVTVVAGGDLAGVRSAFGAAPEPVGEQDEPSEPAARFTDGDGAVVVVEDNGYQGSRSEVLRSVSRASASGKAASIFWNVEDLVVFTCARRGKLLGSLELLDVDEDALEGIPKSLHRLALTVDDEGADPVAVGAALVARFTGAGFGPQTLERGTAYELTPPPDELQDFHPSQSWLFEDDHPDLFAAVLAAAPERQRAAARFAAQTAAREAGIEDERGVRELLEGLGTATPRIPSTVTALAAAANRRSTAAGFRAIEDQAHGQDAGVLERTYLHQRSGAFTVLRQATHPDPVSAAVTALLGLVGVARASVDRFAAVYREDRGGRRLVRVGDLTSARVDAIAAAAHRVVAGEQDVAAAVSGLPPPLTDEERDAALRDHRARYERGEFREYQLVRTGGPWSEAPPPTPDR